MINTTYNPVTSKLKNGASSLVANVLCWALSITCIAPVIWMIYSSLKTDKDFALDILALPESPQWGNYVKAFIAGNMGTYAVNSLLNSVLTTVLTLLLAFTIGYCLSRFHFRGRNAIYFLFMAGMLIPIYALLLPIFIEFKYMHLVNKVFTLLLQYISFALPMAIFLVESYVRGIPVELEEASYIDGCSHVRSMFSIIMPVCKPVLATSAILTFLNTWNEFPLALVLISNNKYKTVPIGLTYFRGAYATSYVLLFAALTIASIPVIVIYLCFYNQIMKGMVAGAVKG